MLKWFQYSRILSNRKYLRVFFFLDEEWNNETNDSSPYLLNKSSEMILPRASRHSESSKFSPEPQSPRAVKKYQQEPHFGRYPEPEKRSKYPVEKIKEIPSEIQYKEYKNRERDAKGYDARYYQEEHRFNQRSVKIFNKL